MTLQKRIAIIGGLGTLAGANVRAKLIDAGGADSAGPHCEVLFEQHRFAGDDRSGEPRPDLNGRKRYIIDMLQRFERAHADSVLLPCFISHTFLRELQPELSLPILNLMDAVHACLQARYGGARTLGILTTTYVRHKALFESYFEPLGYAVLYPDAALQDDCVMPAIYGPDGLQAGGSPEHAASQLLPACADLATRGADLIIAGATEIAMIAALLEDACGRPVADTNQAYADYALAHRQRPPAHAFKIGIIGGIGPAATVDFMNKIIHNTVARRDQDHIRMIIDHNPHIPDRTANLVGAGEDPTIALYAACKRLEANRADLIAIPCNTAHAYVERIEPGLAIPIVNMLSETVQHICRHYPGARKVGLLATSGTIASGVYHDAARGAPFELMVPDEAHQALVMSAIYGEAGVKAGHVDGRCQDELGEALAHLAARGATLVILGCTELPLLLSERDDHEVGVGGKRIAVLDPTSILARRCVSLAQDEGQTAAAPAAH